MEKPVLPQLMKTNILHGIVSFQKTILESGIKQYTSLEKQKGILRLNLFLSFALAVVIISLLFSFFDGLYYSSFVNFAVGLLLGISWFLNKDGHHNHAKKLGILTINMYFFAMSYVEGLRSGQYLLFFPFLLALIFVIDIKKNNYEELIATGVTTLLTFALIFVVAPYQNKLQKIPQDVYSGLYSTNLSLSLLITTVFAYFILKTLETHEEKILEEKMLTDTIYDTSLDAVFIVDRGNLLIKDCNKRVLEMFDYSDKKEIKGIAVDNFLGASMKEQITLLGKNAFIKNSPWFGNMDFVKKDDTPFYAYVNIVPFTHQHEQLCKISILDITEIKIAEFEILKAKEKAEKAAKVKSRFLSNMSHELRTPLNAIIGTVNILVQEEYLATQRQSFDVLRHSSEHMLQLVNDILDYSKLEAGKMQLDSTAFNLKHFLQKVIFPFSTALEKRKIEFESNVDSALNLEIIGDELRLNQVLNNLLSNAAKFTEKGNIDLIVKAVSKKTHSVEVYFAVKDTGIGIPAGKMKQIFESFTQADIETTRKYGGTGLGLAISKGIVENMGGELKVQSEVGKGSTFYFTVMFKVNRAQKDYVNEESLKELANLQKVRVLLAEDNPINMIVAKRFLQKWNVEIDEAVNGLEAVSLFEKNKYDLLLVDLEMPEMDGSEAVAEIRKKNANIPIIAFTAAVYDDMQSDLISKGFTDFIPKPFRPEDLHKKILQLTAYGQLQKFKYE